MTEFGRKLLSLFRRSQLDRELEEEMRAHLEMKVERQGQAARRQFGNVTLLREVSRDMWGWNSLEKLSQDLRYGLRTLRRSPGVTAVGILSLALGIGANTAIFSLMDAVLLKMLPVREPEQLVLLAFTEARGPGETFPYPLYEQLRERSEVFSGLFAFAGLARWSLSADGQADLVVGQMVSGSYHSVLGVSTVAGRPFSIEDDRTPGAHPVAVISYGYWKRRFGLDRSVVGKSVTINSQLFTIVGVTPPEFFGVSVGSAPDVTVPLSMDAAISGRRSNLKNTGYGWLQVMARLKPGVTEQQALAGTSVVYRQALQETGVQAPDRRIELRPGSKGLDRLRQRFSEPLRVLAVMVGLVLLIACANIANLLLARASARQREIAVRLAIGAGRARLIRQLLTESMMLAVTGGALGVVFAQWGGQVILRLAGRGPDPIPIDLHPDLRVLGFTAAASLLTGILFGLAPALRATRVDPSPAAAEAVRGAQGVRLSKALVVAQVGLSLLLLFGAGLFVRTLRNLKNVDAGFDRQNLVVFSVNPVLAGYPRDRAGQLSMQLVDRVERLPGVRSASLSLFGLMEGNGWTTRAVVPGFAPRSERELEVELNLVGPKFFETVGIPIGAGRSFEARDQELRPKVVVINETMARHYFGSENPMGRAITVNGVQSEIVGLVKDAKSYSVRDRPTRKAYVPFPPTGAPFSGQNAFSVRASGDPSTLMARIRQEARALDPNVPLYNIKTMAEQIDHSLSQERLIATLASFFGLLALLLACVGLYGVMSYAIVRRTKEIGIRMALGAQPGTVQRQVLRETLLLVAAGVAIGVTAALATSRLVAGLLFGIEPGDPLTLFVATLLMIAVAAAAGYLPARKASQVDPMVALRYE